MYDRRGFIRGMAASAALMGGIRRSYGQDRFPNRPLRMIVPFAPGADTDSSARLMARIAEGALKQPVIVHNRAGAAGSIGTNEGANAAPDGYTITVATPSSLTAPYVKGDEKLLARFEPIALPAGAPFVFVVRDDAPWKTFTELLDYARKNPRKLDIANTGEMGLTHILGLGIETEAGIAFTHIPYNGSGPGMVALLGGQVSGMLAAVGTVLGHLKGGRLRALAIGSRERFAPLPDVPTFKELGLDVEAITWWGFVAPKGTPPAIVTTISDAMHGAVRTAEYRKAAAEQFWLVDFRDAQQFTSFVKGQDAQLEKLISSLIQRGIIRKSN